MTSLRCTLAAGGERSWDINGDWYHVLSAPVNDLIIRFDDGEPIPAPQGVGARRYYEKVTVSSATGQDIVVLAGFGSVTDGRSTANVNVAATVEPGNTFDNGGDVSVPNASATQLVAADVTRLYALVSLPSDAAGSVRVGSAAVGLASGTLLEPGMSVPIATTAALYAYHENGVAVNVVVASVREV
jgi:hypothetical protein